LFSTIGRGIAGTTSQQSSLDGSTSSGARSRRRIKSVSTHNVGQLWGGGLSLRITNPLYIVESSRSRKKAESRLGNAADMRKNASGRNLQLSESKSRPFDPKGGGRLKGRALAVEVLMEYNGDGRTEGRGVSGSSSSSGRGWASASGWGSASFRKNFRQKR